MSSDNKLLTYKGVTKTYAEWASEIGITPDALYRRINKLFWDVEKALHTPNVHSKTYNGKTLKAWEQETGIDRNTLWHRFNTGKQHGNELRPVVKRQSREYPQLIYGYHRERIYTKQVYWKRCCYPDCFDCPYKDCVRK